MISGEDMYKFLQTMCGKVSEQRNEELQQQTVTEEEMEINSSQQR